MEFHLISIIQSGYLLSSAFVSESVVNVFRRWFVCSLMFFANLVKTIRVHITVAVNKGEKAQVK